MREKYNQYRLWPLCGTRRRLRTLCSMRTPRVPQKTPHKTPPPPEGGEGAADAAEDASSMSLSSKRLSFFLASPAAEGAGAAGAPAGAAEAELPAQQNAGPWRCRVLAPLIATLVTTLVATIAFPFHQHSLSSFGDVPTAPPTEGVAAPDVLACNLRATEPLPCFFWHGDGFPEQRSYAGLADFCGQHPQRCRLMPSPPDDMFFPEQERVSYVCAPQHVAGDGGVCVIVVDKRAVLAPVNMSDPSPLLADSVPFFSGGDPNALPEQRSYAHLGDFCEVHPDRCRSLEPPRVPARGVSYLCAPEAGGGCLAFTEETECDPRSLPPSHLYCYTDETPSPFATPECSANEAPPSPMQCYPSPPPSPPLEPELDPYGQSGLPEQGVNGHIDSDEEEEGGHLPRHLPLTKRPVPSVLAGGAGEGACGTDGGLLQPVEARGGDVTSGRDQRPPPLPDDTGDATDGYEVPSKVGASKAETQHAALVAQGLHFAGLLPECVTARSLAGHLIGGKDCDNTDALFVLTGGQQVLFEYDPGFTHGAGDIARDKKKTTKLVENYPNALVVRLRVGAAEIERESTWGDKVLLVVVEHMSARDAAQAAVHDIAQRVITDGGGATAKPSRTDMASAEAAGTTLWERMDEVYADAVAQLATLVGDEDLARELLKINGVPSRISSSTFKEAIQGLLDPKFGITNLKTFLCGGVVAKCDEPEALFGILDTLQTRFGIENLETFMCSGVAAKFSNPEALYDILDTLQKDFRVKNLQTFMWDGVAARFSNPEALYDILHTLQTRFGIENLQTFMCGGVAAKFSNPEALYEILHRLQKDFGVKNLQTFMCNSLAKKFENPNKLYNVLETLDEKLGKGGAHLAGTNAFASRMLKPGFVAAVVACGARLLDLGLDPVEELMPVLTKNAAKLMDKIGQLRARLERCEDGREAKALLTSLRDIRTRRDAWLQIIAAW